MSGLQRTRVLVREGLAEPRRQRPPLRAMKPRPTVYNGIPMRSRLEARFARYLDMTNATWVYEPRAYGDVTGQYLPDFEIQQRGHRVFIEVKPTPDPDVLEEAMQRMERVWSSEPDASLMVVIGESDRALLGDGGHWQVVDYPWAEVARVS